MEIHVSHSIQGKYVYKIIHSQMETHVSHYIQGEYVYMILHSQMETHVSHSIVSPAWSNPQQEEHGRRIILIIEYICDS